MWGYQNRRIGVKQLLTVNVLIIKCFIVNNSNWAVLYYMYQGQSIKYRVTVCHLTIAYSWENSVLHSKQLYILNDRAGEQEWIREAC